MNYNKLYSLASKFHKALKQGARAPIDTRMTMKVPPRQLHQPGGPGIREMIGDRSHEFRGGQDQALNIIRSLGIPLDKNNEWQGSLLLAVDGQGHWLLTHVGKDGRPTLARVDMATGDPEKGKTYGEEWWIRTQGRVNVIAHYQDFTPAFTEGAMGEYEFGWEGDEAVYEGLRAKQPHPMEEYEFSWSDQDTPVYEGRA
jgi:hypothetical protein